MLRTTSYSITRIQSIVNSDRPGPDCAGFHEMLRDWFQKISRHHLNQSDKTTWSFEFFPSQRQDTYIYIQLWVLISALSYSSLSIFVLLSRYDNYEVHDLRSFKLLNPRKKLFTLRLGLISVRYVLSWESDKSASGNNTWPITSWREDVSNERNVSHRVCNWSSL